MEIKLEHNIKELTKNIEDQHKRQIPFATHKAMRESSFDVVTAMNQKLLQTFHKPIKWTQDSHYYQVTPNTAKEAQGNLSLIAAKIAIKGDNATAELDRFPAFYLAPSIVGGTREAKRGEKIMRQAGILKSGEFVIPSKYYTDPNGNIKAGIMTLIISRMKAFNESKFKRTTLMNETERSKGRRMSKRVKKATDASEFFFLSERRGKMPKGIYERRQGGRVIPVLFIVGANNYSVRYPFPKLVQEEFGKVWDKRFKAALDYAISTAR